jgi:hypothetical protein
MKKLLVLATALFATSAFAGYVTGDKINFQSESTFVSAVYNKTLCLDGTTFKAVVSKCVKWSAGSDSKCLSTVKVAAAQPMYSTRMRCASYSDDNCSSYNEVSFNQSATRKVTFYNNNDDVVKTKTVVVPACK